MRGEVIKADFSSALLYFPKAENDRLVGAGISERQKLVLVERVSRANAFARETRSAWYFIGLIVAGFFQIGSHKFQPRLRRK